MTKNPLKNFSLLVGLAILLAIFTLSVLIRYTPKPEVRNIQNLDASLHVLFSVEAMSEAPLSLRKFLPLTTLGAPFNKYIGWGGAKFDTNGDAIYTSFPPLGFLAATTFFKALKLPIALNSLFYFNITLQLIAALLTFFLAKKIATRLECTNLAANACAVICALPYLFSIEALYSFGYIYWPHCLFQVIFIAYLSSIFIDANESKTDGGLYFSAALLYLMCLTEWSGYLVAFGASTAIYLLPTISKAHQKKFSFLSITAAMLAGATIVTAYACTVGLSTLVDALSSRFFARNFSSSTPIANLFSAYVDSYGFQLLLLPVGLFALWRLPPSNSKKTCLFLFIVALSAVAENLLMKQHATEYHFDRLKVLALFTILTSVAWQFYGWKFRSVIVLISCFSMYMAQETYHTRRFLPDVDVSENAKYKVLDMEDGYIATSHQVRGFLPLLFHRNVMEAVDMDTARSLQLTKNAPIYWIEGTDLSNLIIQISAVYRFGFDNQIDHFSALDCDKRLPNLSSMRVKSCVSTGLLNRRSLALVNVDINSLNLNYQQVQPFNLTNSTWKNGVARPPLPPIYIVKNTELTRDVYLSSRKFISIAFDDGFTRTINQTLEAGDFLNIYISGPGIDTENPNWSNAIKISKLTEKNLN